MRRTRAVTSFLTRRDKFLILRRSGAVRTMPGLWAGISGTIHDGEDPLERARVEIQEEVGMQRSRIVLVRAADPILVRPVSYEDREWEIFPFLFEASGCDIVLNWENVEHAWIHPDDLSSYETVPDLERVLYSLL